MKIQISNSETFEEVRLQSRFSIPFSSKSTLGTHSSAVALFSLFFVVRLIFCQGLRTIDRRKIIGLLWVSVPSVYWWLILQEANHNLSWEMLLGKLDKAFKQLYRFFSRDRLVGLRWLVRLIIFLPRVWKKQRTCPSGVNSFSQIGQWWRPRCRVLVYGDCGPGFDSWRRLKFFQSSHRFSTAILRHLPWTSGFFYVSPLCALTS